MNRKTIVALRQALRKGGVNVNERVYTRVNRINVPPPIPAREDGLHNIRIGKDEHGQPMYFGVTNPIRLTNVCGRNIYKERKREHRWLMRIQ